MRIPPARLPDSRAEFYREAVDFLLTPWHGEHPTDPIRIRNKRRALQCHALAGLTSSRDDWPVLYYEAMVAETATLLNWEDKDADDLLREIVERSGLLRWSDDSYRFAHLTFQEFLAAEALRGDAQRLLKLFLADPDRWQEVVVLWCGIARDATGMLQGLTREGSLVALECLSEVRRLDEAIVRWIIEAFRGHLEHADADSQAVRAFGIAASGPSTAARIVFGFLVDEVESAPASRRAAAAHALAISRLPEAAVRMGRLYGSSPEVRASLERMRDSAIEPLVSAARGGDGKAFDGLRAIGTPPAVHALVELLWNPDDMVAARAAWELAAALTNPTLEATLAGYRLADNQHMVSRYRWVWEPFTKDQTTRVIVSRIAWLLKDGPEPAGLVNEPPVDDRLATALGFVGGGPLSAHGNILDVPRIGAELVLLLKEMERVSGRNGLVHAVRRDNRLVHDVFQPLPHRRWSELQHRLFLTYLKALGWGNRELRLLGHASTDYLAEMLHKHEQQAPSDDEWRLMFKKGPGLWPAAVGCAVAALAELVWLILLAVVQTSRSFFPPDGLTLPPPTWLWWSAIVVPTVVAVLISRRQGAFYASTLGQRLKSILVIAMWPAIVLAILLFILMPSAWLHATTGTWWSLLPVWSLLPAAAAGALYFDDVQIRRDRSPLKGGLSGLRADHRLP